MAQQITPVTDQLAEAMNEVHDVLHPSSPRQTNDKASYENTLNHLEVLTIRALAATSSAPFLGQKPTGARFDFGAHTELARHVSDCVAYLRDEASELLAQGGLSQYENKHTIEAMALLKGLYGLLTSGIAAQAKADLVAVLDQGPTALIQAAEALSDASRRTNWKASR